MLKVYYSDRMEILATSLAERLKTSPAPGLYPYWVGVRNPAMGQWLRQRIASQQGAVLNLHCVDGQTWARKLCWGVCPDLEQPFPWERHYLNWRILAGFNDPAVPPGPWQTLDPSGRFRLAWQLAGCFSAYLIEEPDWLARWGCGEGDHWQARLWWALGLTQQYETLLQRLANSPATPPPVAACLGVGFPHLPPRLLRTLAAKMDLHVMVWMPSGAASRPQQAGNPLRRTTLDLEQRQYQQLQALADQVVDGHSQEPPATTLLGMLQGDILADRLRGGGGLEPRPVSPRDRSLQVHSCHSPMREVEVLYEQLLALFQADPTLQPADIQVLLPPEGGYGALVEAVFGAAEGDRYIPFSVMGEARLAGPSGVFMALLELPSLGWSTAPVLAILEKELVRRRFGLGLDDLPVIQHWVGTPALSHVLTDATHGCDWRQRLASLMLGYMLGQGDHPPVGAVLADTRVQDSDAAMLGRLQGFVSALIWLRGVLEEGELTLVDWQQRLLAILEGFFEATPTDAPALLGLRQVLLALPGAAQQAGFAGGIPLVVLREYLSICLKAQATQQTPIAIGGVRFATPHVALGTPAAVVCVLGAATALNPGDRPGTLDQRWLNRPHWRHQRQHARFLQALLAARRVFYVSYVGRSIHDNRPLPVATPVAGLLETVATGFWAEGGGTFPVRLEHGLLSVSPRYFRRGSDLFSYAEDLCVASRILGQGNAEPKSLVAYPLTSPEPIWHTIELESLAEFYRHPTRYLLRERLSVDLEDYRTEDRRSAEASLASTLLGLHLQGPWSASLAAALRAAGQLPSGQSGELILGQTQQLLEGFVRRLRESCHETLLNPLELDTIVTDTRLVGRLHGVSPQGLLAYGAAPLGAAGLLQLWLRHLVLNLLSPPGVIPVSTWLDPWGGFSLQPVAEPLGILDNLLDCYREGLRRPLHLFPETALAFVQASRKADLGFPEEAARRAWEGLPGHPGEEQDPYIRLAFRGEDPLEEEFARLSTQVFLPVLERRRRIKS